MNERKLDRKRSQLTLFNQDFGCGVEGKQPKKMKQMCSPGIETGISRKQCQRVRPVNLKFKI